MLSLLLSASLWPFDAPLPAERFEKEFVITHEEAPPSLREQVASQLESSLLEQKPGARLSFSEPGSRYPENSPLARMLNERDDGSMAALTLGK
ncbi:hypothetical protein [Aeromonas sp. MdU4]|uniref:hypothetical protein n=1 Tax=Aeromonas sp. MdU4 TaxID=3342819 RepID=UPI0035BB5424